MQMKRQSIQSLAVVVKLCHFLKNVVWNLISPPETQPDRPVMLIVFVMYRHAYNIIAIKIRSEYWNSTSTLFSKFGTGSRQPQGQLSSFVVVSPVVTVIFILHGKLNWLCRYIHYSLCIDRFEQYDYCTATGCSASEDRMLLMHS